MSISDGDYELAIKIVLESSNASCSHLQRKLNWGYARASMAIDRMEREFIVGAMSTTGKRDVLPPCVHELWEKSQQQEKEIQALKRPLKLEKVLVLMDQFKKTRTFKLFYSTLFRFNEDLNCFVSTEKWRDKEAELLTVAWWMFAEVAKHQAVPEGFVLLPKTPTALTDEVLGLMPHEMGIPSLAEMLRKSGVDLPRKIEKEQSYILLKILVTALEHGDQWRSVFADEMKAINAVVEDTQS